MKRRWSAGVRKSLYGRVRCTGAGEGAVEAGVGARRLLVVVWVVAISFNLQSVAQEWQWWVMWVSSVMGGF